MKDNGKYLILPLLNRKARGCVNIGVSAFAFLSLLVISVAAYPTEPEVLILTVPAMLISLYIGIRWFLLCVKKLRMQEEGLQVLLFGRCIQTIPAERLQMVCMVTGREKQGRRNGTTYRLRRRLAIFCKSMEELEEQQLGSVAGFLEKRMKYHLPIDGVWADCYPELVAGLRLFYPDLKWEQVSTVSLTNKTIRDDDPCYFMRNPSNRENIVLLLIGLAIAFGIFVFLVLQAGMLVHALQVLGLGLLIAGIFLLIEGNDRALVLFMPEGIQIKGNGMTRFYPAGQLRTAVVYTQMDYYDGRSQVIVFSTLSAREIAQKQEKKLNNRCGGESMLRQFKKIPDWGTRLAYRFSRDATMFSIFYSKETNYIMHSPERERALRELYPQMQWLCMTDEFEVIV